MFYQQGLDNALRLGDVLSGFVLSATTIDDPQKVISTQFSVSIEIPDFVVVLSPCCSIEKGVITLTPLIEVRSSFFNNPYFIEDLTRINRIMRPEDSVSPSVWKNLGQEEQNKRLQEGPTFAFSNLFIYEKNQLFKDYVLHRKEGNTSTNYYMIDFKNTHKINCSKIINPQDSPFHLKYLQLSIDSRSELRLKLAKFYSRIPDEDRTGDD
ncbi:MAG: hypothetical protein AB1746_05225 [Candidatus Zixiibacteriota bacterium]